MKRTLAIYAPMVFFILFLPAGIKAQQSLIKGVVTEKRTGEPIELAEVKISGTQFGATTDEKGVYFILGIDPGTYVLEVVRLGYESEVREIVLGENEILSQHFTLHKTSYSLEEVAVSAARTKGRTQINISEIELTPKEMNQLPSFGSLPDVVQQLQSLPGVITRGDLGSQLYIRGGSPVQNRVLMDGAVLYNPFHSSGLYSVFELDAIRRSMVYTGGFGAEYGASLSSIIDVTTRNGNITDYSGKADVSTLGSNFLLEGPVFRPKPEGKSNASFLTYYKNSYMEQAGNSLYSYTNEKMPFRFQDFYGKFTLFSKNAFQANLYGFYFTDHAGEEATPYEYNWRNAGFGANFFLSPVSSSTVIHGFFAVSGFQSELQEKAFVPRESNVNSVNLGLHIKNYFSDHTLKYGLEILTLKTDYLYFSTDYNQTEQGNNSSEVTGFVSFFGDYNRFLIQPGLRTILYSALNKISLEPRLSMKYLASEWFRIKLAGGLYSQNLINAASDRDIVNFFTGYLSAPVDVATSGPESQSEYVLQRAWHLVGGLEFEVWEKLFVNVETFYKDYPELVNYNRDKLLNAYEYPEYPEILTHDFILETGTSWGVETSFDYHHTVFQVSLNYTLSKAERTYWDPSGNPVTYAPHYDRRHNLNLIGVWYPDQKKRWEISTRWSLGSGFPFTRTKGFYEGNTFDEWQIENYLEQNGTLDLLYGNYNEGRLPTYHRLDIGILRKLVLGGKTSLELELNIINVYNRENVYYIDRSTNEVVYQLPVLPALRVGFRF